MNNMNFTIGADPELFVKNAAGQFTSGHNLIPGDKANPFVVKDGAVQVDGLALEFNINPASSYEEFQNNLDSVKQTLRSMIGDHEFLEEASVMFDADFTKDIPMKNMLLGCEADYNGWTLEENTPASAGELMRTAGGHVHVGGFHTDKPFSKRHFMKCARLARIMDETLGVPSVLWDGDDKRRSMYGKAGAFRPKPYGMEYRTLSNRWIFEPRLVKFVYEGAMEAVNKMFGSDYEPDESVVSIINESRREEAVAIFQNTHMNELVA